MAFNVNELAAEIANRGVLKTNKFLVEFPMPLSLRNNTQFSMLSGINRDMSLYCESTNLPGVAVLLEEIRRYGYGPNEKKPHTAIFSDVNLTFRGDANGEIWTFLNSWMKCTTNYESRGDWNTPSGPVLGQTPGEVGYKYDPENNEGYATDVTIRIFDETSMEVMRVVLREAYPVFVGDVPLNWASRSDYMRIPVTLTFFDWYNDFVPINNTGNIRSQQPQ